MTIRDLIIVLLDYAPDTEVVLRCENGIMDSTSSLDTVEEIVIDYEGTPGIMDDRLFYSDGNKVVALVAEVGCSEINR